MPLYIDLDQGLNSEVFDDLVQIARCDPGLTVIRPYSSWQSSGGGVPTTYLQVMYQQKQLGVASSNLLLSVVSQTKAILIVGVASTYIEPDGSPITTNAGVFYQNLSPPTIFLDCGGCV
jgi:hypothetical protein